MKKIIKKISAVLRIIFGYGITICLFAGGLTFVGYTAALCIGGDTAAEICDIIYNGFFPVVIKTSNILVLLGLAAMYLNGESSLKINYNKK